MDGPKDAIGIAAGLIRGATSVLVCSSAGMSADSGIPTFRDEEGLYRDLPIYRELNVRPRDLMHAPRGDLSLFWGFKEYMRRRVAAAQPHRGYAILERWRRELFQSVFVHTTNVDGYHARAGWPPERIYEIHGSIWELQQHGKGRAPGPGWWRDDRVPLCELDEASMVASNLPSVPESGAPARTRVLLFDDPDYVDRPEQDDAFQQFLADSPPGVVLLIGSSGRVPTNDLVAESVQGGYRAKVICINPDRQCRGAKFADVMVPMGALAGLTAIEEFLAG